MTRFLVLSAAALALSSCAAMPGPSGPVVGSWGGQQIGLQLNASGGTTEYDCAAGTIDEPLIAGADGEFAADGRHTPGTGGPDRVDEVRPSYPARYTGQVTGDAMRLHVSVPARNLELGPFELRRGAQPQLLRCL